jgi:hypothetical protein
MLALFSFENLASHARNILGVVVFLFQKIVISTLNPVVEVMNGTIKIKY